MLQLILMVTLCAQALCTERVAFPEVPPGEAPDPLLKFYETIYKPGRARSGGEGGEPLILTRFIEENKLEEAREAARVNPDYMLPDMDSYAGYFTVNKEYNSNLFFWYFPVEGRPVEDTPWIIWLQGGPGASSLYGLFTEIGPFIVTEDDTLEEIKYSWGKNHSLLFIDNPVGTGFSYTDDDRGYATNQTTIGENLYNALQQFLTVFPELRKAPLTISGESYAGKHIPSLGIQILWHRDTDQPINLYGLAIGNGFMDPVSLQKYSYFVREAGLVDDRVADMMRSLETAVVQFINNGEMIKAFAYFGYTLQTFMDNSKLQNLYNYLRDDISLGGFWMDFLNRDEVRSALHVGNRNFTSFGLVYKKLVPDFMNSAKPWIEELIQNYPVMCYSGHLDIIVAYHPSVHTYHALQFPESGRMNSTERRSWYHNGNLAGYVKTVGNFSDVMVRGAGHMVPTDQPAAALAMISAFARGLPLEDTEDSMGLREVPRRRQLTKRT